MLKYDFLWYKLLFDMTKVVVIIVNSVTFFAQLNDNLIYLHLAYIPLRDFYGLDLFSLVVGYFSFVLKKVKKCFL